FAVIEAEYGEQGRCYTEANSDQQRGGERQHWKSIPSSAFGSSAREMHKRLASQPLTHVTASKNATGRMPRMSPNDSRGKSPAFGANVSPVKTLRYRRARGWPGKPMEVSPQTSLPRGSSCLSGVI